MDEINRVRNVSNINKKLGQKNNLNVKIHKNYKTCDHSGINSNKVFIMQIVDKFWCKNEKYKCKNADSVKNLQKL